MRARARRRGSWGEVAALLSILGVGGCPEYAPGTIQNPSTGPMAASDAWIFVTTPAGDLVRARVDGSAAETVVAAPLRVVDADAGATIFVLSDADTNLYLQREGGAPRPIPALAGRLGDACLSADGRLVAAIRHADFSTPQATWRDDDAVYVIDVEGGEVRIAPAASERMPTRIRCEAAANAAWVSVIDGPSARVDLEALTRRAGELPQEGLRPAFHAPPPSRCPETGASALPRGFGGDEGIDLVEADGARRRLVIVEGRRRGFHDYLDTVDHVGFVPGCAHVVFAFERAVWVTDVASGVTRQVIAGDAPTIAPPPPR